MRGKTTQDYCRSLVQLGVLPLAQPIVSILEERLFFFVFTNLTACQKDDILLQLYKITDQTLSTANRTNKHFRLTPHDYQLLGQTEYISNM